MRLKKGIGEMIIANNEYRKLPVGIQSFNVIREEGYLYVDKTDMIWKLANQGFKYNYLSRPRRFGKSVLIDTLQAYFEGRKDLFEGLKIMELEKDWKQYPVIRLDMSRGGATANEVKAYLDRTFDVYEQLYGIHIKPTDSLEPASTSSSKPPISKQELMLPFSSMNTTLLSSTPGKLPSMRVAQTYIEAFLPF